MDNQENYMGSFCIAAFLSNFRFDTKSLKIDCGFVSFLYSCCKWQSNRNLPK